MPESADDLLEITLELLRRNGHDGDAYVRPIIYKAAHSIRVQLSDLEDRIGIFTIPLGDYLPTGGSGSPCRGGSVSVTTPSPRGARSPAPM